MLFRSEPWPSNLTTGNRSAFLRQWVGEVASAHPPPRPLKPACSVWTLINAQEKCCSMGKDKVKNH